MKIIKSKFKYLIPALIVLLLPDQANASWFSITTLGNTVFAKFLEWEFATIGNVLVGVMDLFQWLLSMSVGFYDVPVVDQGWTILRDFANMFFIVALIIMAFATIFEVSKYSFGSLITRFLLSAVLINFSLPLTKLLLQFSDVLSHIFLSSLGNVADQLGEAGLALIGPADPNLFNTLGSVSFGVTASIMTLVWGIILTGILLVSMSTAAAFIFVRIPIIWFLIIFAPIAILLNVFPNGQGAYKKWLNSLIGWALYLPVFLFFLYLGLFFLSRQEEMINAINSGASAVPGAPSVQLLFSYFLACFFIIYGVKMAHQVGFIASANVVKWTDNTTGYIGRRTGLTGAWQRRKAQFVEQGFQNPALNKYVYGGKGGILSQEGLENRFGRMLGVKGANIDLQKQFVTKSGKEFENIQAQYDIGKVNIEEVEKIAKSGNATDPKIYAHRKMLAKLGKIDQVTYSDTLRQLSNNPFAAQDFSKTAKEAKYSNLPDAEVLSIASGEGVYADIGGTGNLIPARKEMYRHIQSEGKLVSRLSEDQFEKGLGLFGGHTTSEGKSFMGEVGKARPDLVINYNIKNGLVKPKEDGTIPTRSEMFDGFIKEPKDVANLPLKYVWEDPDFQGALVRQVSKLSPKARQNFFNRLEGSLRTAFGRDKKLEILNMLFPGRRSGEPDGGGGVPTDTSGGSSSAAPRRRTGFRRPDTPPTPGRGVGTGGVRPIGFSPPPTPSAETNQTNSIQNTTLSGNITSNPKFKSILEEKSLNYLKSKDADYFYSNFSGDLSPQGYLLDKNGSETNIKPSQNIGGGEALREVVEEAYNEFSKPDIPFKPEEAAPKTFSNPAANLDLSEHNILDLRNKNQ